MTQIKWKNLVWNKHHNFKDIKTTPLEFFCSFDTICEEHKKLKEKTNEIELAETTGECLLRKLKDDGKISFCIFDLEKEKEQTAPSFHIQGYLEFKKRTDVLAFNKKYKFSDIQKREGTKEQAIEYVRKREGKISNRIFSFGKTEKSLPTEVKRKAFINEIDFQMLKLDQKLEDKVYENFNQAKEEFKLLYIKHPDLFKKLWNSYHPVNSLDVKAARTIWIYGISGIGKSTWTDKFLKQQNFSNEEISIKKASNEVRPILWFTLEDEEKKVLWVEEIRTNFPNHNDIIQIIDRKSYLETKGSQIRNNFELIIFNSLFSPLEVYRSLPQEHQIEVLRRLYRGNNSVVLEIVADKRKYNKIVDRTNDLPEILLNELSKWTLKPTRGLKIWDIDK